MVRRRKTKSAAKRISFKLGRSKKRKKRRLTRKLPLKTVLKVLVSGCVIAAIVVGFVFLRKYVEQNVAVSSRTGTLKLVDVPDWVNESLIERVYTAAVADGEDLKLDDDAARSVQQNVETRIAWLDEVTVQATNENIIVSGRWRKPIAVLEVGLHKFYVDARHVVLDFVAIPALPIVRIKGLSRTSTAPPPGLVWQKDDLVAAVAVLTRLEHMDNLVTPDKPLLYEIDRIDVSNFNGRQNSRAAHIILYTKQGTEIIWGAEVGTWQRYLEATDEQKLAKLYGYYTETGPLLSDVKYINLRDPQQTVPLPVDKKY